MIRFDELAVPGPIRTPVSAPFWDALEQGRFEMQRCRACRRLVFYPRALCPHCWSEDLAWAAVRGAGRLASFRVIHRPGHPGWRAAVPYVVGVVALEDGPTMLSLILVPDPGRARVGMPLRLAPTRVGSVVLPLFAAADGAES